MKTGSEIDQGRAERAIQGRFNPLRNITPENLVSQLDRWRLGYLRDFASTADALIERSDIIRTVSGKRHKAAGRHGWEIVQVEKTPEAARHAEVLKRFWDNITVTSVLEQDERGGLRLLARQMMSAVGMRYAVHEIVWSPRRDGLTAEFRFVPLWFFESTTGRLRFLKDTYDVEGVDLEDGGWLITCMDGLMPATAVAWMFQRLPLQDWLVFCERFAVPGVHGKTDAPKGSPQWTALEEAVVAYISDSSIVTSKGDEISLIEASRQGDAPMSALVERSERAISALWRGGDLGTMSKGNEAVGANAQADESSILEEDDRETLSETLNLQIDRRVIEYAFGKGVTPLAYLRFRGLNQRNTDLDLRVDQFLLASGFQLPMEDVAERYNRRLAAAGEISLRAPAPPPAPVVQPPLANSKPQDVKMRLAASIALDMKPVRDRLAAILQIQDEALQREKLAQFRRDLDQMKRDIGADPAMARELEAIMGAAMVEGLTTRTSA